MSVPVPHPPSSESPLPACVSPCVFASPPPAPVSTPSSLSSHGLFEYFLPNILWFPESSAPPLPSPLLHPGPLSNGWGARRFSWARGLPDDLPSSAPPAPSDPRACELHPLPSCPSLTCASFLHRSGDTRGRGASPLSPRLAPALSAHPPWALSGLWGKRCFVALGAQDTGPLPSPRLPQRAFSCQVPFWPFVREHGPGSKALGYLPSAEAPVTGLLCPAFAPASPTRGPHLPVWPGRAAGAADTLPTHLTPASSPR